MSVDEKRGRLTKQLIINMTENFRVRYRRNHKTGTKIGIIFDTRATDLFFDKTITVTLEY